ncbi:MAG: kynureninase [Gammaproteobacteria bacterium]
MNAPDAATLDVHDPLAEFRAQFHVPPHGDGECVYLCGNSLGLQPKRAARYLEEELDAWRRFGVEGHFRGQRPWKDYHELFAAPLAALAGAHEHEVVCMNGLTVNLHLLMVSFFRPTTSRYKLLIERSAFPSDRYAVVSQLRHHGLDPADALIEVGRRAGETHLRDADIAAAIREAGGALAMVLLPGVQYLSGEALDIAMLTAEAHAVGAIAGWDLAHAIGNLPLALHDADADFAAWCSYKYLNGGPGAVAGAFVHERHGNDASVPRFAGWWGHDKAARFRMAPDFNAMPGADGWQLSNPPVLGMAPLLASLELFTAAGMAKLRAKSVALTALLERRLDEVLADEVTILTPRDAARRGCQLSLRVRDGAAAGRAAFARLGTAGVVCDWREPDVIRVAPVPLYNRFADIERFVAVLQEALQ